MILDSSQRIKYYMERGIWEDKTLLDYYCQHAKRTPDRIALVDPYNKETLVGLKPEKLTFEKVDQITDRLATGLIKEFGIVKDDIIMLQLPNINEAVIAILGAWKAGAIITFIPVTWREREFWHVAGHLNAKIFISFEVFNGFNHLNMARKLQPDLPGLRHILDMVTFSKLFESRPDQDLLAKRRPAANDVATFVWTSGTEAMAKCCPRSHTSWIAYAQRNASGYCAVLANQTILVQSPISSHAGMCLGPLIAFVYGMTCVMHHPFDFDSFLKQIHNEKVTILLGVPALLNTILKHPKVDELDLGSVNVLITGSAPPSVYAMESIWKRWQIEVINGFGSTEGTSLVSGPAEMIKRDKRVNHLPWWGKPGLYWRTLGSECYQTRLVDPETGTNVWDSGLTGELWMKTPTIIPQYYKQPEYTRAAFDNDGFFHTGDIFKIQEDAGYISYFDRKKDIIIRGGNNVSASEVENIAISHPAIAETAAVAMPDERLGEKLCLYVVLQPGKTLTLDELTGFILKQGVAKYKLPERLEIIDGLPRNSAGKVLKWNLREDIRKKVSV